MKESSKDWEWKKLGQITECLDSKRIPVTKNQREKGDIPYYGANGIQGYVKEFIFDEELLLVAEDGGSWGQKEKCTYIIRGKSWVNNHAHVLRMKPAILIKFLEAYLNKTDLTKYISGTTRGKLNQKQLNNIEIPVPPLPIQRKIVSILEHAEKLKNLRQEANDETNIIIQALFYEMFENVAKNPYNFEKVNLGKVVQLQGGYAFKSADYEKEGIRLVTISNVHNSRLIWEENTYLPEDYLMEYEDFALNEGDLVIAMTRPIIKSLDTVKLVEIQKSDLPALLNQRVGRFKILSSKINKKYLEYFCYGFEFKKEIEKFSSVSLQPNVSSKQIESIEILLPPISLQNQFASLVEKIESIKKHQTQSTEEINTLFDALMQKAFSGELTV